MEHTMTREQVEGLIEQHGQPVFLNHNGERVTEEEVWEQYDDGWHVGVMTQPISNAIAEVWIVATSKHSNHYGFDAGEVVEQVVKYEERDEAHFIKEWSESGGVVFRIE